MGNCQAIDSATLVIQYPNGRVDKLYCPVPAAEIMKMNPGHYVALLLTTTICPSSSSTAAAAAAATTNSNNNNKNVRSNNPVRITRIKLLRPTDTLSLGHVYRLITTQEVMKGLCAKKYAKMKKAEQQDKAGGLEFEVTRRSSEKEKSHQATKHERRGQRTATGVTSTAPPPTNSATARPRAWQPALNSISEAGS